MLDAYLCGAEYVTSGVEGNVNAVDGLYLSPRDGADICAGQSRAKDSLAFDGREI